MLYLGSASHLVSKWVIPPVSPSYIWTIRTYIWQHMDIYVWSTNNLESEMPIQVCMVYLPVVLGLINVPYLEHMGKIEKYATVSLSRKLCVLLIFLGVLMHMAGK